MKYSVATAGMIATPGTTWLLKGISNPEPKIALTGLPDSFPRQDSEAVRAVVGASHAQFDKVKELVSARPELAKAQWDWGYGDWESAVGAASHMGRADIAEFLMKHGARPNLFTYAILGKVETVKSIINEMPGIQSQAGPHGITLMRHVKIRQGKDELTSVQKQAMGEIVDFLESVGGANTGQTNLDITETEQKAYSGRYNFGSGDNDYFVVDVNSRGTLSLRRAEEISRAILRVEEHAFAPAGAPSVRIRFDMKDGWAESVTIHDPIPLAKAARA